MEGDDGEERTDEKVAEEEGRLVDLVALELPEKVEEGHLLLVIDEESVRVIITKDKGLRALR